MGPATLFRLAAAVPTMSSRLARSAPVKLPGRAGREMAMSPTLRKIGRLRLIVAGLTMALVTVMPAATVTAAPPDPFLGSYRAIDFDGSEEFLAFGGPDAAGGPTDVRRVILRDDNATIACGGGKFFAEGIGFVDGNEILVVFELYCGNSGNLIGEDVVTFTADPATGTLTDQWVGVEVIWTRP